jgi:3-methyladenine DNA glycosylase/8-oxoguanine DNA glycosylase
LLGAVGDRFDPDRPMLAEQGREHLARCSQLYAACLRFSVMDSIQLQEQLDRADTHAARRCNVSARQAAYIEALARDGPDAATTRKLLRAFEDIEARHKTDRSRCPWRAPS